MSDIRITPAASLLAFSSSLGYIETLTQGASGSIVLYGSGSAGRTNVFAVDGTNGRLFSVDDDLSNSLFSVNTIAGLPVIEAFANNTVNIGKYGAYSFVATGSGDARIGSGSVMFVSASGNVGIGTASPQRRLQITDGEVYIRLNPTTVAGTYLVGAADGKFYIIPESTFVPTVTLSAGNVGIGTTGPTDILDVQKNQNGTTQFYFRNTDTTNASSRAYLNVIAGTNRISLYSLNADNNYFNTAYGDLHFQMNASTSITTPLFISSSGNVGIGTTSPNAKLESTGKTLSRTTDSGWGQSAVANPNDAEVGFVWAAGGTGYPGVTSTYTRQWIAGLSPFSTGTDRWSLTNKTLGANTAITVLEAGNVGIGTTTPTAKLQVSAGRSHFFSGDNYSVGLAQTAAQGNYMYLGTAADGTFYISETGGTARVTVQQGGNVGINTTSPQKILDVAIGSNDFATVGAMTSMGVGQWAGVHFGYRENNTNYRKSAIVFERTDNSGGGSNASGKVHILNGPAAGAGSATLADAKLTVNEYGAVGIGTTSPNAPLDVTSATSGTSGIQQWSYNSSPSTYRLQLNTIVSSGLVKYSFDMLNNSSTYDNVLVLTNGNVGIGTASPTQGKLVVNGGVYATSFTGSLQGSASYATTSSYSLNAGSSATFNNNTNNYIMTGTGTTNTLNGESNLQYDGNGLFIGNAGSIPGSPTNGTVLYSEDVASSSELKVKDEAGNITTLSPHNFSLIPQGPSEALAWSYYSEKDGKKINVDMLKLARILEKLTGEKLVYIE